MINYQTQHWQTEELLAVELFELEKKQMIELHNKRMELEVWKVETIVRLIAEGTVKP